jgi:diguanylate cyclase (GGDEF)-like protein
MGTLATLAGVLLAMWIGVIHSPVATERDVTWLVPVQLIGPLAAAVLCALASRTSVGTDRQAWARFGWASAIYAVGNLSYAYFGIFGPDLPFPSVPELAFFIMAGLFASGLSRYGQLSDRIKNVQLYNFLLLYGAVTVAFLFLLHDAISASTLTPFATVVAFSYPALWFSIFAFGAASLILYDLNERTFPFVLILLAILLEAIADLRYALDLIAGTFEHGGTASLLWAFSAFLICCAAVEQMVLPRSVRQSGALKRQFVERHKVQASIPAIAIGVILMAGSASGAFGTGIYQVFSAMLAVAFAAVAGLREYAIIRTQRALRVAAEHAAHHDLLTGLANRLMFQKQLQCGARQDQPTAVVLLGLDKFKDINDALGHPIGDAVLRGVADRLTRAAPQSTLLARLGGDEFALLLSGSAADGPLTELVQRLSDAVRAPSMVENNAISVSTSIGVAMSENGGDRDLLLKNADIALYVAKGVGPGSNCFYEPAMEHDLLERQALRNDLAGALDRNEFELHYQPILDYQSGQVSCLEALLRWRHPSRGMVPPSAFIPAAEEGGLIASIGEWVLRTACQEAARWPGSVSVAVNLSTRQFSDADLPEIVADALLASGLDANRLELEITESVLLQDSDQSLSILEEFRRMGIRVALDDFGTGYSSLAYLQKFQFNKIKIDRSFVSGLETSGESRAIVNAVISLGRSLGMRVTAEGIETPEQFRFLSEGCDEAQGFFLSRPVPASQIPALLGTLTNEAAQRRRRT